MKRLRIAAVALGLVVAALPARADGINLWDYVGSKYIGWAIDATTMAAKVQMVAGTASIGKVTELPTNAAATVAAKTVANSSSAFLAASAAATFLQIKNESTTASIALAFDGGTAALNTAGSITLGPGQSITFDGSFVPSGAITAISSAATSPATVISN